jgi:hypothetical protein
MGPVNGELVNKLDSKTAKTGDRVAVQESLKVPECPNVLANLSTSLGMLTEYVLHNAEIFVRRRLLQL